MYKRQVYGLVANALDAYAVAQMVKAKGRPQDNPLIVHIADYSQLDGVAAEVNDIARSLICLLDTSRNRRKRCFCCGSRNAYADGFSIPQEVQGRKRREW